MPKATTKAGLIKAANDNFEKMFQMIDSMTETEQAADFCYDAEGLTAKDGAAHWKRDKNLRDMLTHLYEWHGLVLAWVESNEKGKQKPFLPPGITWANYQKMNVGFFEKHQSTPYDKSRQMVKDSHKLIMALIEKYGETELFAKYPFKLTGKSSIAEYCRAATASHYDWAVKKLKEQLKALNKRLS